MNSQNQPNMESQAENTPEQLKSAVSRRKFILGAASASVPVIAAVHSGSAWSCVDLNCSPGKGILPLSTGGSAVASAVQTKANISFKTNRPNWSSIRTITNVIQEDFFRYLYKHYRDGKTYYYKIKSDKFEPIGRTSLENFVINASGEVYVDSTKNFKVEKVLLNRKAINNSNRTNSLLIPASFNGVFINRLTTFGQLGFSGVNTLLSQINESSTVEYKFVLAAFVGALWERHPEYSFEFPHRLPCYPAPDVILRKFNSSNAIERQGLDNLFEYYTTGKVDGKDV